VIEALVKEEFSLKVVLPAGLAQKT
jgi:hypothetical protein